MINEFEMRVIIDEHSIPPAFKSGQLVEVEGNKIIRLI